MKELKKKLLSKLPVYKSLDQQKKLAGDLVAYCEDLHKQIDELVEENDRLKLRIEGENNLRDEIADGLNLIDELREENTKLVTALNKKRDDYKTKLDALVCSRDSLNEVATTWRKRWEDEHEKYMDLCREVQSYVSAIDTWNESISVFRDSLMATSTIDT